MLGDREGVVTLGLVRGRRQHRVARVDGRRVVGQLGRRGRPAGGVLAVVVSCVAARGRGARGGRGYARGLHVQGHAHLAVTRQGTPAPIFSTKNYYFFTMDKSSFTVYNGFISDCYC